MIVLQSAAVFDCCDRIEDGFHQVGFRISHKSAAFPKSFHDVLNVKSIDEIPFPICLYQVHKFVAFCFQLVYAMFKPEKYLNNRKVAEAVSRSLSTP